MKKITSAASLIHFALKSPMTSEIEMTTTVAEQVAGNNYLLDEILIRLPPKSVTRSKLVSKQWLAQISDPQFVRRHSQHKRLHSSGMFVTDDDRSCRNSNFVAFSELNPTYQTIPSLGFLYDVIRHHREEPCEIEILNSCNGLFVLAVIWKFSRFINYCVCNPTTKTFTLVPANGPHLHYKLFLVFEPSISSHYKLVSYRERVRSWGEGAELDIYSSENRSWKTIASPFDDPYPFADGFYLNGKIYWLSTHNSICFDSYNDELKPMNVPPNTDPGVWTSFLVVGSHLYYLDRKDDESSPDFRLIEITGDFSERVTKYDTDVCPLLHAFPQLVARYFLEGQEHESVRFCFSGICGVEEDEAKFVLGIPGKLVLYNLKEKTAQELYNLPAGLRGQYRYKLVRVFQFCETLSGV